MTDSIYKPQPPGPEDRQAPVAAWRIVLSILFKITAVLLVLIALIAAFKLANVVWALAGVQKEIADTSPGAIGSLQGRLLGGDSGLGFIFAYLSCRLWGISSRIRVAQERIRLLRVGGGILVELLAVLLGAFAFYSAVVCATGILGATLLKATIQGSSLLDFGNFSVFFFWLPSAEMLVSILLVWLLWKLRNFIVRKKPEAQ